MVRDNLQNVDYTVRLQPILRFVDTFYVIFSSACRRRKTNVFYYGNKRPAGDLLSFVGSQHHYDAPYLLDVA